MCGICGIVNVSGLRQPESARLWTNAILAALAHRGPDDTGIASSDSAVIGATRLVIRGKHDGRQPMLDAESGVVAVCNGEIDNHRELRHWLEDCGRPVRDATDVAVIPGLYLELGEAFINKLTGAFAVAVWDPRKRLLILARDRAGERPLFFVQSDGEIVFATEISGIVSGAKLPAPLNQEALKRYLQFGFFASPDTPLTNIQKIPPGGIVQIDPRGIRHSRYWRWNNVESQKKRSSLDAFDPVFRQAVRRQSEVDVDFGLFLSGGVDSSLVSAVTRSLYPKRLLKAYTLRFEEESFDEGHFAADAARMLKMESVSVWVRPEDFRSGVSLLIRMVGEPLADPAWLPTALLAGRAAQDVRMALVGEGADELFGGYPTYLGAGIAGHYRRLPAWLRTAFRRFIESRPIDEKKVTVTYLLKRFVRGAELEGMARHRLWTSNVNPEILARLGLSPAPPPDDDVANGILLDRVQRWDMEGSLAEGLLTKADRASMSSALELRAPFLDESVMAFAATLPAAERVHRFATKVFLKRYALRYLPKSIVYRRKRGLSVPINRWLRGPLRDWAAAALGDGRLARVGIRNSIALELLSEHCRRQADHTRTIWTLIMLSEWLDWLTKVTDDQKLNAFPAIAGQPK
jgi:asparagine synthase (glutamine-hydrolysing)